MEFEFSRPMIGQLSVVNQSLPVIGQEKETKILEMEKLPIIRMFQDS